MRVPDLDVRYMLEGTPIRMRYTYRWATSRTAKPENVAEHSWFVCFYSMMILRWLLWFVSLNAGTRSEQVALGNVLVGPPEMLDIVSVTLQYAVIHDIEESRSGDVHRPFKYSTPELKRAMKGAAELAFGQLVDPLTENQAEKDCLTKMWKDSKGDTIAGRIVRFADFLAVLAFVKEEGKDVIVSLCLDTLPKHYEEFLAPDYDFIRPLVDQVGPIVKEILGT